MGRVTTSKRLETLEHQQRQLHKQLKATREEAARKKRDEDKRRKYLIGAAVMAELHGERFGELVREVVVRHTRTPTDLALFDEWLRPEGQGLLFADCGTGAT